MPRKNHSPIMKDVCREAGVSRTTVSYILSGSKYAETISPETRQRVLDAAARLGYSRNPTAIALSRGYSDNVVLLAVSWSLASSYANTTMSISQAATSRGLKVIVEVAADDAEALSLLQTVPFLKSYGLLTLWDSKHIPIEHLAELRSSGLPVVDLLPSNRADSVSVTADREGGFHDAVKHLIDLGHRRIGIIIDTVTRNNTNARKLNGYRKALESAGIEFDERLVAVVVVSDTGFDAGREALPLLLDRNKDMTAVICMNDPTAIGAIVAAMRAGLSVPGDLSIIGNGDQPEALYVQPELTTLAARSADIAEQTIEVLTNMRTDPDHRPRSVSVPMTLIIRESTGPAPAVTANLSRDLSKFF